LLICCVKQTSNQCLHVLLISFASHRLNKALINNFFAVTKDNLRRTNTREKRLSKTKNNVLGLVVEDCIYDELKMLAQDRSRWCQWRWKPATWAEYYSSSSNSSGSQNINIWHQIFLSKTLYPTRPNSVFYWHFSEIFL